MLCGDAITTLGTGMRHNLVVGKRQLVMNGSSAFFILTCLDLVMTTLLLAVNLQLCQGRQNQGQFYTEVCAPLPLEVFQVVE